MFNCAATHASSRPLLYNCIMTLFNFVTSKKTKDWFKDHAGKMPIFPTYIALLSDKLFVGFVKSAENYTNQCTVKDGLVIKLDTADLSRALDTFYNIVKVIKKCVDNDKLWVNYPAFLSLPPNATLEGSSKWARLPPPTKATTPSGGGRGGHGGSPEHSEPGRRLWRWCQHLGYRCRFWRWQLWGHRRLSCLQRRRILRPPRKHAQPRLDPLC